MAAYVTVEVPNGSFELPGVADPDVSGRNPKQKCWDGERPNATDVPGWNSDLVPADSGVESNSSYGSSDGDWTGYLMSGDPSVWNLLPYVIQAGDEFMLSFDAMITGSTPKLIASLYYQALAGDADGYDGYRAPLASEVFELTTTWTRYSLKYAAPTDPGTLPVGRKLGIEIVNSAEGNTWLAIDRMLIPEPATIVLLGLGGLALLRVRRKG